MSTVSPLNASDLYRVVAENATDAIITIDQDSIILSINPAGERLLGRTASSVLGSSLTECIPPRYRDGHRAGIRRYLATGTRHIPWQGVQLAVLASDGREIPVEISFGEFISDGRRIFSAILRDISERLATEATLAANAEQLQGQAVELEQQIEEAQAISEELEQSNEELHAANTALRAARVAAEEAANRRREVLDILADAVCAFDVDGRWTYLNPAARTLLASIGHEPDPVIADASGDAIRRTFGEHFQQGITRALSTGTAETFEEFRHDAGRWLEHRILPSPNAVTTFTRDVTAAHLAAEAIRSREAEYRALANSIPTLAWMARPDGWIFWYNERWYEYTGTVPADMEGWGWQQVHHPDALPDVLEKWTRSIETGQPFEMTFPLRGADGTYRPFLTRVFPLRDESGALIRWFGTNTDISHEHAARVMAERAAARTRLLQSLTALLARAHTLDDVASVVVREAVQATGAATGMLALADGDADVVLLGETGLPRSLKADYVRFPITRDTPSAECIRTSAPIYIGHREGPDGLLSRYPALRDVWNTVGRNALASVPLLLGDRAVGAMSFTFPDPQEFDEEDREFFTTLAAQGAQAIARVRAFEAERRERQRSESIVEAITDGFVTFDRNLRFTYVNARAAAMFGVERAAIIGRPIDELPQSQGSPFVRLLREVIDDRQSKELEAFGTIMSRWLGLRAYPAEDGGVIVYFQDVTERRRQLDAAGFLAEASALLASSPDYLTTLRHLAMAAIPRLGDWCAVELVDDIETAGRPLLRRVAVVHVNPEKRDIAEEYQRLSPDPAGLSRIALQGDAQLLPRLTEEFVAANIRDVRERALIQALGAVSAIVVPLKVGERVLGTMTCCVSHGSRQYDEGDLQLAEDLAARAANAVEHARLLERAEAANAAKTEFLRTVSHELRQPLNAMAGLLQLWELGLRGTLSPQQVDDLERIKRNQQQLATLIEDLLSFARLEAGKLSVMSEPVTIASVLEGLRASVCLDLDSRGIEYSIPTADTSVMAVADPGRLHQVLVNLLTNAMKATSRGDRIDVTYLAEPDIVRIRVRDTGNGIPSDMLDAIFTPFVQVGRALNQPREGAGLGLAISRGLVEAMGGTLSAQSEVGVGSTFTVTLPRAPAGPPSP